jgi:hypothetical protein
MNAHIPRLKVVAENNDNPRSRDPVGDATEAERAEYLAAMILELKSLSEKQGFETLSNVLEVAWREAQEKARQG